MGEAYFNLKHKLAELGYNNTLPPDAVPLVECIVADLLQTTRSLQHYMHLSKEALEQRDSLLMEAEPYKCDNARLIQENNNLHKEVITLKEENLRITKESKRKIKALTEDLSKKEATISKLQHDVRDLSLRGLCAGTLSSRNKSRRRDHGDDNPRICICNDNTGAENDLQELRNTIQCLEDKNNAYNDENALLKSQVDHRDNEIVRLNILLEGGRPINTECCNLNADKKVQGLKKQINELESANECLRKEIENGLQKQHEAMVRALSLADKNKGLQQELKKVDALALKVEEDCNKRLSALMSEIHFHKSRLESMVIKNTQLEKEISQYRTTSAYSPTTEHESVRAKERETLQNEIKDLLDLNKSLQEKVIALSQENKEYFSSKLNQGYLKDCNKYPTKDELQNIMKSERAMYEKHLMNIQEKLSETIQLFNDHLSKCKSNNKEKCSHVSYESGFVKDLHSKLCESEQKILMLKKDNDEMKSQIIKEDSNRKQNWKDIIQQLNTENADLSHENIRLSQQLSHYKNLSLSRNNDSDNNFKHEIEKLKEELHMIKREADRLRRDKEEYKLRLKESTNTIDRLKSDLNVKLSEIEIIQEENNSYKMTQRTGKASADHLKEECNFLREQIKKMQSDVIKEKTMANQIKNIQQETERSSNEMQGEILYLQKKMSVSKDTIESLEKKCKDFQSEIISLKEDKTRLIQNIKTVDQERDKLVIELDNKTETISVLEQKLKTQSFDIRKLEEDVAEQKRKLTFNKVSEHKLIDSEAQLKFLNGEIARWKQQYDNALIENKHLQNSLADAVGNLKITKIEYGKAKKEIEELKQQLQHYVTEIRRIEEMLSHKEAERSDMLENFASLSVEANILENTNHSLESESASKSMQLQTHLLKIQELESKLLDKDNIIDKQSTQISELRSKISVLETEVRLIKEEKEILEQNVAHLKQMCGELQTSKKELCGTDSELKLYENRIKSLAHVKDKLEDEKRHLKDDLVTTERLLSNARKEIIELKLAFQDATSETKSLKEQIGRISRIETEVHERTKELELPQLMEETIHEVSHEEDEDSSRYHEVRKRISKYSHGGTW